jgi:serine/threonine-protein kinase HipA
MLVADETRLGALRFREAGEGPDAPFLSSTSKPIPPLLLLRQLLSATDRIIANEESDDDLALVLAPGTSLGGARPKASVRGAHGELMIAKFPRKDDDWPITRWEATTLSLAKTAGIQVPKFRLEHVLKKPVLLLERFDRNGSARVPFMSAMTALSADDHQSRSYTDIVDTIRREGSRVTDDLRELWRRLVFNILVSNTDDHLRNHGFLRAVEGWRLAPAYDLNPTPTDVGPRAHSLGISDTDGAASFDGALGVCPLFGIGKAEAKTIAREVTAAVRTWRTVAARFGLKPRDLERMESAFEHEDLERAAKL